MSVNKMIIQGRLVAEPELRATNDGTRVASFRLAWSEKFRERESKVFLTCVAWGKLAEFVGQYFHKGQEAVVEGKLLGRSWEDQSGGKRYAVELKADQVHFCGPKQESGAAPARSPNVNAEGFETVEDDGELPF